MNQTICQKIRRLNVNTNLMEANVNLDQRWNNNNDKDDDKLFLWYG